jgi:hypothetical protein
VCGQRFVVYLGALSPFNERAFETARERAEDLSARFIDVRSTPWLICSCGELPMFVEVATAVVM